MVVTRISVETGWGTVRRGDTEEEQLKNMCQIPLCDLASNILLLLFFFSFLASQGLSSLCSVVEAASSFAQVS